MKTDISSSAEGNDKLQSMQAEELTGCDSGQPILRAQNQRLPSPTKSICLHIQIESLTLGCAGYEHLREHTQASISAGCPSLHL